MATSSFTRKIIVTGKEATDAIVEALTCDVINTEQNFENRLQENRKRGRASLEKFASHYENLKK